MKVEFSSILSKNEWLKPVLGFVGLFALCTLFSPVTGKGTKIFIKFDNLSNVLRQVSEIGIISIGMTLVIITSGIDLSVGSVLALAATLTAFGIMDWQLGFWLTIIIVLFAGAFAGFVSGSLISWGKIQAFIVTLAMMTGARGFALFISDSNSRNIGFGQNAAPEIFKIFTTSFFGIPFPVFVFVLVAIIFSVILRKMRLGRHIYAIGSNEEAARLAGLRVNWIRTSAYVFSGLLAALSGIIHSAQLYQGNPNDGVAFELDAIAAVVIGGTSLQGGKGTMEGTIAGVLIIGILSNILGLHGIQKDFQLMLKGAIIVSAVLLQEGNLRFSFFRK